jgi:hypothetical protein
MREERSALAEQRFRLDARQRFDRLFLALCLVIFPGITRLPVFIPTSILTI